MEEIEGLTGFPKGLFAGRRKRVLASLGNGAMILPAAPSLLRAGDSEIRYRPDSDLFYLTGFSEPGALLVLRAFADEARSILYVRPRDDKAERWEGSRLGVERAGERIGVEEARSVETIGESLVPLLSGADRIHFRLGTHPAIERRVVEALRLARTRGARDGSGPRGVIDPGEILNEMRLRKDSYEVAALREAAEITVAGFRAGLARVAPGVGEWEVEAEVEAEYRRRGATAPAFATIVASGRNACTLHYVENGRRMEAGDLVLVDAGAERRMYGGDMSRTVPVGGLFTSEQRAVYQVVEEARRSGVAAIRPGATVESVHASVVRVLVSGLLDMGVLKGEVDSLIEAGAHEPFFPHKTSHWLGLNTHDVGDYARDGRSRTLEPGMVLTVEPGLYIRPEQGDEFAGVRPYLGTGVRIEDDVLVTEEGAEVLGGGLPTDADEVEAMMAAAKDAGRGTAKEAARGAAKDAARAAAKDGRGT